jgi:hypothetical protein
MVLAEIYRVVCVVVVVLLVLVQVSFSIIVLVDLPRLFSGPADYVLVLLSGIGIIAFLEGCKYFVARGLVHEHGKSLFQIPWP